MAEDLGFPIAVGIGGLATEAVWRRKIKKTTPGMVWKGIKKSVGHTRDGVEKKEKIEKWASRPRVNDRVTDPHLTAMS